MTRFTVMAGLDPIGIRIRACVEANVLSPVMPGLDPGIRPSTAAAMDGRAKPGHDVEGTVPPAKVLPADALILMPMGLDPAIHRGTAAGADTQVKPGYDVLCRSLP